MFEQPQAVFVVVHKVGVFTDSVFKAVAAERAMARGNILTAVFSVFDIHNIVLAAIGFGDNARCAAALVEMIRISLMVDTVRTLHHNHFGNCFLVLPLVQMPCMHAALTLKFTLQIGYCKNKNMNV